MEVIDLGAQFMTMKSLVPEKIHFPSIWTSSAYGATDPPGYWVANGRDEERFCLNVTFTGLTIYLERRVGDEAWGEKTPNSFLFRKSRRLFYFLSRNMLKDDTENNDVKGQAPPGPPCV